MGAPRERSRRMCLLSPAQPAAYNLSARALSSLAVLGLKGLEGESREVGEPMCGEALPEDDLLERGEP